MVSGNSTTHGNDEKAYELNETPHSVSKQSTLDIRHFIVGLAIVFVLLAIGYIKETKKKSK